jgi:hypothetical protein
MTLPIVIGIIAVGSIAGQAAATCNPSNPAFVCGLTNAEDLVRLTGTPWIVASHLDFSVSGSEVHFGPHGPLEAVRIDTHEVRRLYPTAEAGANWDRKTYSDCPTPPASLSSHGLNVRFLEANRFRLYVANHGGRESVEIIDVAVRPKGLLSTWRGCIRAPEGISPNGLVPLAGDALALSGGHVAIWRPSHGWKEIAGIKDGNGIEVSRDGRWLFINIYGEGSVVRVPVAGGAMQTIFKGDFLPDNLRWGEDGRLYVAGQYRERDPGWKQCTGNAVVCDVGFVVAQIDPNTLATKEVFRSDGIKGAFGAATTALQVGDHFWIGSFWGDRVMILRVKQ